MSVTLLDTVSVKSSWGTPADSLSFDLGQSYPSGTFFLLWVTGWDAGSGIDILNPAGWTRIGEFIVGVGAGQFGGLYYRYAEADEPEVQSISGAAEGPACDYLAGTLSVFSGVHQSSPLHTYALETFNGVDVEPVFGVPNEGSYPLPSLTTTIDDLLILTGVGHRFPNQDRIDATVISSGFSLVDTLFDYVAPNAPWSDIIVFRSTGVVPAGAYQAEVTIEDTNLDLLGGFLDWVAFSVAIRPDDTIVGECLNEKIVEYWDYDVANSDSVFGFDDVDGSFGLQVSPQIKQGVKIFATAACGAPTINDGFTQDLALPAGGFGFCFKLGPYIQGVHDCDPYTVSDVHFENEYTVFEVPDTLRMIGQKKLFGYSAGSEEDHFVFEIWDSVELEWVEACARDHAVFRTLVSGLLRNKPFWVYCFLSSDGSLETWFRRADTQLPSTGNTGYEPNLITSGPTTNPPTTFGTTQSVLFLQPHDEPITIGMTGNQGTITTAIDELAFIDESITLSKLYDLNDGIYYPGLSDWESTCELLQNFVVGDADFQLDIQDLGSGLVFTFGVLQLPLEVVKASWGQEITFLLAQMDVSSTQEGLELPQLDAEFSQLEVVISMSGVTMVIPIREILSTITVDASIQGSVIL